MMIESIALNTDLCWEFLSVKATFYNTKDFNQTNMKHQ